VIVARYLQYIRQTTKQQIMLIAFISAIIAFAPMGNAPRVPVKHEVVRQPIMATEQQFFNIPARKKGRK
jgi:hypothetical protein